MSENEVRPYGAAQTLDVALPRQVRTHHLQAWKSEGHRWAMLTAYDFSTARLFAEAGIPVLLVGDSAANVVYGYDTTVPLTTDELLPLVRAVTRGAPGTLVIADLVFGSYEESPAAALRSATRMMKEGQAHAVKLEGGENRAEHIRAITAAGIPVCAHIGFTPQSVHGLGGFRVQGRGEAAEQLLRDARAVQEAGAFAVVMEMVPEPLAREVTEELSIPTVGIGAGRFCDAQVLVWHDMAGMSESGPRFARRFAETGTALREAAAAYRSAVARGDFPAEEHTFQR